MNSESINYGKIIKTLRKKNKMTQSELGAILSVGKTSIANYESGYSIPSAPVLEKIAAAFEMNLIQFLQTSLDMQNPSDKSCESDHVVDPKYDQNIHTMSIRYIRPGNISVNTLDAEKYKDSCITIPGNIFRSQNEPYFFTKMTDNSIDADGIKKNDYVFVRETDDIKNNQIVFAIDCVTNEYYIRRYMRENHILTLIPSSYSQEHAILREDFRATNIKIVGCVEKALISFSKM